MKKTGLFLSTILLLIVLTIGLTLSASAEDVLESGTWGDLSWLLNKTTGELTISGEGNMKDLESLTLAWAPHKQDIKRVTIQQGITSIGGHTFWGCTELISISLPDSITSIGDGAFSGCVSLANITIPDSVTNIGYCAFSSCMSLTNITIPDSVTSMGGAAFSDCTGLTSITIGDRVTSIGIKTFYGCESLESITIPKNVISIEINAFYECMSLTSITVHKENPTYHAAGNCLIETESKTLLFGCRNSVIPTNGSVTSIGSYAFSRCISLASITIPNSITHIGSDAFFGCRSLVSITIPNSVTRIGKGAFRQCSSLVSVTLPDSINLIEESLFAGCTSLKSIVIPDSVTRIASNAFNQCTSLERVTLPKRIANVNSHAFLYCTSLKEIALAFYPYHIQTISPKAFEGCTNLSTVIFCGTERQLNTITLNESLKRIATYHDLRCEMLNGTEHKEVCAYCDYEVIQEHTFGDWQPHDATQHKRECACGEVEYEHHVYSDDQALTCTVCSEEHVLETVTTPTEEPAASGCGASVSGGLGLLLICLLAAIGISWKKKES